MQDKDDKEKQKHPIEMTSDELLDYAIAPEVAEACEATGKAPRRRPRH